MNPTKPEILEFKTWLSQWFNESASPSSTRTELEDIQVLRNRLDTLFSAQSSISIYSIDSYTFSTLTIKVWRKRYDYDVLEDCKVQEFLDDLAKQPFETPERYMAIICSGLIGIERVTQVEITNRHERGFCSSK